MKIVIDAMGGDNGSPIVVEAIKNFLDKFDNCDDKAYNLLFLDNKKLIALEKKENIKRYNLSEINKIVNSHFLIGEREK